MDAKTLAIGERVKVVTSGAWRGQVGKIAALPGGDQIIVHFTLDSMDDSLAPVIFERDDLAPVEEGQS